MSRGVGWLFALAVHVTDTSLSCFIPHQQKGICKNNLFKETTLT
jgi:hypothetical protein